MGSSLMRNSAFFHPNLHAEVSMLPTGCGKATLKQSMKHKQVRLR